MNPLNADLLAVVLAEVERALTELVERHPLVLSDWMEHRAGFLVERRGLTLLIPQER